MSVTLNSNCQSITGIESVPIGLNELVEFLKISESSLSLAMIKGLLKNFRLDDRDIDKLALFDQRQYHRQYLYSDEKTQVLMLGWLNGQRSKIHDHMGSNCAVKILKGTATETYFDTSENNQIFATGSSQLNEGEITTSCNDDKHQISNLQGGDQALVTLHIYSPPLDDFNLYSLESAAIEKPTEKDKWMYEI